MAIFTSGTAAANAAKKVLRAQYLENKANVGQAQTFAEEQLQPYMLDPSIMQELQGAISGADKRYMESPLYERFVDVGRETMLEDMAGTGTLYSGKRIEGMRDLGQSAFSNYMNALSSLAGFGRDTASQVGGIRMQGASALAGMGQQYASDVANIGMAQSANQQNMMLGGINALAQIGSSMMMPGA